MRLAYLQATWHRLAIAVLFVVAACLFYATPLRADPIPAPADAAYANGVASMYAQVEAAPDDPRSKAFRDVLDQLFKPNAVQIPFRFVTASGGKKSVNYAGNIYFSQGEIFINYDDSQGEDEQFATIDGKLYSWETGAKEGKILQRFPGDTLAFVMYMIDPSAIMRTIYEGYLEQPNRFNRIIARQGIESIELKQPQDGFKGIQIQRSPFWLKAFLLEVPQESGMTVGNLEVDPPIALAALPKALTVLPQEVSFKTAEESLKNHMTYL